MEQALLDAAHDGHVAAYTELLKDEQFRTLVGHLATVYAVTTRKVQSIDQRSFRVSKEEVTRFVARTSGWNAKLSRDTRNGSWRRGSIHPPEGEQGWKSARDVERLGGRGSRVRSVEQTAAPPQGDEPPRCPTCRAPATKVMTVRGRLCCPACVRRVATGSRTFGARVTVDGTTSRSEEQNG